MNPIPIPKNFKRLGDFAIDEDSVFTTQADLDAYLAGGTSYAGQVVALVLDGQNEAQIYKVNKDKTLGSIGSVDITVDTEITENSENPVSGGAVFIGLSNKAASNHTHETDAIPTQDSTKLVTSGGVFTELGKKANSNHTHISQERFSLIGHTTIPTAFEEAVNISSVPKYLNLSDIKLIDLSDSSEIAILTAGVLEELPIAVPAGDYNYSISYEEGKESGVLLINFS